MNLERHVDYEGCSSLDPIGRELITSDEIERDLNKELKPSFSERCTNFVNYLQQKSILLYTALRPLL